jgi:hypothetical protein
LGGNVSNSSDGYYIETSPSVNFGGRIANSPKRRATNNSYSPGANDVPQAVSTNNYMSQRPVVTGGGATQNSNVMAGNGYSASGISLSSATGAGGGGASGGGGTGMMAVSGGGRSQSTGNAGGGGGGMMAPFSSEGITTGGPMKAANEEEEDEFGKPNTDPGGTPTGNPIPIGDGSWLLLLFAAVYIFLKNKAKL